MQQQYPRLIPAAPDAVIDLTPGKTVAVVHESDEQITLITGTIYSYEAGMVRVRLRSTRLGLPHDTLISGIATGERAELSDTVVVPLIEQVGEGVPLLMEGQR